MPPVIQHPQEQAAFAGINRETRLALRVWGNLRIEYPDITLEMVIDRLRRRQAIDPGHVSVR